MFTRYWVKFDNIGSPSTYAIETVGLDTTNYSSLGFCEIPEPLVDDEGLPSPITLLQNGDIVVNDTVVGAYSLPVLLILENLKITKIQALKTEGSKRIQTINNRYYNDIEWMRKSQNYQDIKTNYVLTYITRGVNAPKDKLEEYQDALKNIERKDQYVLKINEIEARILAMTEITDVNAINVMDDATWE